MKLPFLAVAMTAFSFSALAASDLPEGFDTFMNDLDFASAHCTRGMYRVNFDIEVLHQVTRKLYDMRKQASGGTPNLRPPASTSTASSNRCFDLQGELGTYAETVLGIPGLVKP